MPKKTKHRNTANPEFSKAMHGLAASSAAEPHKDKRTKRARTRQDSKRKAIKDGY